MKDIARLLRDGDPLAHEPEMTAVEVQAVRRAVVAALETPDRAAAGWPGPLFAAAAVAAALVVGVAVGLRTPAPRTSAGGSVPTRAASGARAQRQLQFASPGGTRIIWVFDPEFNP